MLSTSLLPPKFVSFCGFDSAIIAYQDVLGSAMTKLVGKSVFSELRRNKLLLDTHTLNIFLVEDMNFI